MSGGKKKSGWLQKAKSAFKGQSRSSSSRSEGKTSGASSPIASTASGSVMSLPSRSSKYDSNSLTPTGSAIISGASPIIPEQLLRSREKESTAPGNPKTITQESRLSQSGAPAAVQDEATLLGGSTLLAPVVKQTTPAAGAQQQGSAFGVIAGPAKHKDGTGLTEKLQPEGGKESITHDLRQNTPMPKNEAHSQTPDQKNPPTGTEEPQSSTPELTEEYKPQAGNPTPPISSTPEPNNDILASIHVTIEEIKSAQKVLQEKKWYYTDRHGKQVDVGERMRRILRSVEDCAKIVDIAIQHHPEISSLVWAGARFILMVALNGVQFMDNLEAAMVTIVEKMATCEFYAQVYDEGLRVGLATSTTTEAFEDGLDTALKDLYAAVRAFLDKAKEYFDPENSVAKKIVNHLKPFSVTMQPLIQDILDKEKIVEKYAGMATMERIKSLSSTGLEDSKKLQQVRDVIMQIREEMKPLAKLDELLNVARDVRETLVEFQTQVVKALQPQQREMLSSKSLDSELHKLKNQYMAESQQTDIFHANLYVPAQGMATQHTPEEGCFDLWERLEIFMAPESPQRVCLIQGAAGAGKSTFNHYLATRLWEDYDKDPSSNSNQDVRRPIPVFIPLANFHDPTRHNQDLIAELFKTRGWPEERILKARGELEFIFILDGYDEIEKRDRNFYIDNRLGLWNAKTVITSRPEYLGSGYQNKFYPPGQPQLLQEYWLAPFSTKDIAEYISKYVQVVTAADPPEAPAPSRSVKGYAQLVERPELRAMISNPFLLKMVMTVQPSTGEAGFNRVTLYRKFLVHWLRSAHERLSRIQLPSALSGPFNTLCEEGFANHAETYCLDFAVELYRHKSLEASYFPNPGRSALKRRENTIWKGFLANDDPKNRLLRYSSPLVRVGESYRFLHKSLRDFAVAYSMWQDENLCAPGAPLNEFPIVYDHGIIDFIVEEAGQNQKLQAQLLACVEESKQNPEVATAAANAITVLIRAGKRFHEHDLRGIRIPGADISTGWFGGAQLQGADLRQARLDGIWLRGADLSGAYINGGGFGEKPYFKLKDYHHPLACCYMTDGELLVAAHVPVTNDITVWSATNRTLLHKFTGHTAVITCVVFPPNGDHDLVVSGSWDKTVRLWSRRNHDLQLVHTFHRHTDWVKSVAFSPDVKFLASGGKDSMVYLWSVATHDLIHDFSCGGQVSSLSFSPDSQTLASAGDNKQVNLWSTESGKLLQTLEGHTEEVNSVTFSPNGQILASTSSDKSLKLWLVSDGQLIQSFSGHGDNDYIAIFAPNSQMIASASDSSIRIRSVARQKLIHVIEGVSLPHYIYRGSAMAFSRDGELIATGDATGVVRQWLVPSEVSDTVRFGNRHTTTVNDLAFSHDKKLLASASADGTVHLWSIDPPHMPYQVNTLAPPSAYSVVALTFTLDSAFLVSAFRLPGVESSQVCLHRSFLDRTRSSQLEVLGTHTGWVSTVAFTQDGNTLASGGEEKEIFLWSMQEGTKIDALKGHTDNVLSVDFSPDGKLLVSGADCDDCTVILWSVSGRKILHIFKGHTNRVNHVAFSPDGEVIASASCDNTVRLWPVPDRKSLHIFKGHTKHVMRVAFSPDGFLLASGSLDKTLRLWSLSARELYLNVDVQSEVWALAWTGGTPAEDGLIAIGTETGGVQLLRVIQKQGYSRQNPAVELSWIWATDHGAYINVCGVRIDGVRGLNPTNIELLKQRGAIGEPAVDRVGEVEEEKQSKLT